MLGVNGTVNLLQKTPIPSAWQRNWCFQLLNIRFGCRFYSTVVFKMILSLGNPSRTLTVPAVTARLASLNVNQGCPAAGWAQIQRHGAAACVRAVAAIPCGCRCTSLACISRRHRGCNRCRIMVMIRLRVVRHVRFQRLRYGVGNGFHAVRTEADRAGAADALEVLDQQLHLIAVVPVPEEQGADPPKASAIANTSEPALPTFRKISLGMPSRSLIVMYAMPNGVFIL